MTPVAVTESSQVAEARRVSVDLARRHGFDDEAAGRVAIVATELATNLVKHGGGGIILSSSFDDQNGTQGVELIAIDKGPGMANVRSSLDDGVSTAGTAGNGLGAIRRQSYAFEIFSQRGHGTVIVSRLLAKMAHGRNSNGQLPAWGAVSVPMPGETVCGDAWAIRSDSTSRTVMVVDGLGHGPDAAKVATEAIRLFDKYWRSGPAETLKSLHAGLRATRGGAVAIARIEPVSKRVVYAGVGNIVGVIAAGNGQIKRMLSYNGTIGHNARHFQEIVYPIEDTASAEIILHSDGLSSSWSFDTYPGLITQHPAMLAAVLYRDFARGRDDATIVVTKGACE
ncbi:MAG: ATP-binding protein [Hyphomicrobium sp.]|nr:ATP-binding protein [Hyphomicrobium sp.]